MNFEEDYCELFEQELSRKGQDTLKFCELCELQNNPDKYGSIEECFEKLIFFCFLLILYQVILKKWGRW